MATNKENDVSIKLGTEVDTTQLNKAQAQVTRFFNSFMTSVKKMYSMSAAGINTSSPAIAEVNSQQKKISSIVKKRYNILNPSYGVFSESMGDYVNVGSFRPEKKYVSDGSEKLKSKHYGLKPADISQFGSVYKSVAKAQEEVIDNTEKVIEGNNKAKQSFGALSIVGIYAWRRLSRWSRNTIKAISAAGSRVTELNSRFSIIMGEMTANAEEFATALSNAYGLNEAGIKENMLRMYTLAQNAGLANQNAIDLTKTMSRLAVEVASVWDVPIDQAYNNLISGLQGLPRAMKKYGSYVGTEEIKEFLNQYRRDRGLEETTGELTRQQKVLGVYLKSLSDLGYAFGDFERTSSSVANQTRILSELVVTLQQEFGQLLNTVLGPLLKAFNYLIKSVQYFVKPLNKLPTVIKGFIGALLLFVLTVPLFLGASMLIIFYTQKMKQSWDSLIASQNVAALTLRRYGGVALQTTKLVSGLVMSFVAIITILDTLGLLKKKSDDNTESIKNQTTAAKNLKRTLSSFDDVNIFKTNDSGTNELSFDMNDKEMQDYLESIGLASDELKELNSIMEISDGWIKAISAIIASIGFANIITSFSTIFNLFIKISSFLPALASLGATVKAIVDLFNKWGDMSLGQKIASVILVIAAAAFTLASAIAAIKGNYIAATALGLAGTLGAGGAAIIAGSIPKAAHGGTVSAPTLVETGEGKYSEAIIPLGNSPEFSQMKSDITNAVLAGLSQVKGGNNQPINITINVDEEYIYESYNRVAKQNGER